MDHQIKIKIADRCYSRVIHSEQEEEIIRKAARSVSDKIATLSETYAGIPMVDILTIVALNEGIEREELQQKADDENVGLEKLSADLSNYVDSLQ